MYVHLDSDFVVAINAPVWDNGAHCGQTIEIRDSNTGALVPAKIADECPFCSSESLDLSEGTFLALTGAVEPELANSERSQHGKWAAGF